MNAPQNLHYPFHRIFSMEPIYIRNLVYLDTDQLKFESLPTTLVYIFLWTTRSIMGILIKSIRLTKNCTTYTQYVKDMMIGEAICSCIFY